MEDFGCWLREHREGLGLSRSQFARRADMPENSITGYESGARKPGFDQMVKIARALEIPFLDDIKITLDNRPTKVENLVDKVREFDISDEGRAEILLQALRVLEKELGIDGKGDTEFG